MTTALKPEQDPTKRQTAPAPQPATQAPQTFAQMQTAGVSRPAAPSYNTMAAPAPNLGQQLYQQYTGAQPAGQFTPPAPTTQPGANPWRPAATPMQQQMSQQMMQYLQNPSGYSDDVTMNAFNRMRSQIDEDSNLARDRATGDFARRGLYHSTPLMSKYGDITVEANRAKNDAAVRLADEQAKARSADMARAMGLALGYDQQQFGQGLAYDQFGAGRDDARFGQGLQGFTANQNANQQAFNQRDQVLARLLGFGQQSFDNQLRTAQFNREGDLSETEMYLRLLGAT